MLQTVRCIKFGEILLDANRKSFLLCSNCHTDFHNLEEFTRHLSECLGLEHIFRKNTTLCFDTKKGKQLIGKGTNSEIIKNYFIYNCNEVTTTGIAAATPATTTLAASDELGSFQKTYKNTDAYIDLDLIKIEEELLDPRWYTDIKAEPEFASVTSSQSANKHSNDKLLEYNELVEAVTPFVQFKENLKSEIETPPSSSHIKTYSKKTAKSPNTTNTATARNSRSLLNGTTHKVIAKKSLPFAGKSNPTQVQKILHNKPISTASLLTKKQVEKPPIITDIARQQLTEIKAKTAAKKKEKIKINQPLLKPHAGGDLVLQINACAAATKRKPTDNKATAELSELNAAMKPLNTNTKYIIHSLPVEGDMQESKKPKLSVNKPNAKIATIETTTVPVKAQQQSGQRKISNTQITSGKINKTKAAPAASVAAVTPAPVPVKQTEQILNKLQTLGLQVKRRTIATATPNDHTPENDATTEILKKLQQKGMKIKILNKQTEQNNAKATLPAAEESSTHTKFSTQVKYQKQQLTTSTATTTTTISNSLKPTTSSAAAAATMKMTKTFPTSKTNLNKNLIIRKIK